MKTVEEIMKRFNEIIGAQDEGTCFPCHGGLRFVNWLADLQDCLEEAGVSLEKFCATHEHYFYLRNGRLRIDQCVNGATIRSFLSNAIAN